MDNTIGLLDIAVTGAALMYLLRYGVKAIQELGLTLERLDLRIEMLVSNHFAHIEKALERIAGGLGPEEPSPKESSEDETKPTNIHRTE